MRAQAKFHFVILGSPIHKSSDVWLRGFWAIGQGGRGRGNPRSGLAHPRPTLPIAKSPQPAAGGAAQGPRFVAASGQARCGDWPRSRAARWLLRRSHHMSLYLWVGLLSLVSISIPLQAGGPDDLFQAGDFLPALKAYQAEVHAELVKSGKVSADQIWADSATWEIEPPKQLAALCLFEKGLVSWLKNDKTAAVQSWLESQKRLLAETPENKPHFRRTQLILLVGQWDQLAGVPQKMEAISKAATVIQELTLPEEASEFVHQIKVECLIVAMAEYHRLLPKVADPNFPSLLREAAQGVERNRQLFHLLARSSENEEPSHEAVTDRLLFQPVSHSLWEAFDSALAAHPAPNGNSKRHLDLLKVFAALDAPKADLLPKRLAEWIQNQPAANASLVQFALLELLRAGTETSDTETMNRLVKGVGAHLSRVSWPNDAFRAKAARLFQERGDYVRALALTLPLATKAADPKSKAQALFGLVEVKIKTGDAAGALEDGKKAMALFDQNVPPRLHRLMATACINLKKYPEGIAHLENYLTAFGKTEETVEAQYLIGWLYSLDQKFDEAQVRFQSVVETYPDSPFARKSQDYLKTLPQQKPR